MYLPTKNISTHPRYVGSGVFGSIGKLLGRVASKASGEAAKKLAKKAVSKAGEQAGKALLKKTQAVADEKVGQIIDTAIKKVAKPKAKVDPVAASLSAADIINKAIKSAESKAKPKAKLKAVTQPVSQLSADAAINKLMAGSGNRKLKGDILKLEDIINRGINTPFLPEATTFGSGIKTL